MQLDDLMKDVIYDRTLSYFIIVFKFIIFGILTNAISHLILTINLCNFA